MCQSRRHKKEKVLKVVKRLSQLKPVKVHNGCPLVAMFRATGAVFVMFMVQRLAYIVVRAPLVDSGA